MNIPCGRNDEFLVHDRQEFLYLGTEKKYDAFKKRIGEGKKERKKERKIRKDADARFAPERPRGGAYPRGAEKGEAQVDGFLPFDSSPDRSEKTPGSLFDGNSGVFLFI